MIVRRLALGLAVACFVAACTKVPETGRSQFNIVSEQQMAQLGRQAFQETLAQEKVVKSGPDVATLNRVGGHLSAVVDRPDYAWDFALIDSAEVNAWALPGGYIGFYEGILPVLRNEAGMAFVMGHEVGHVTANHAGERMSQQLAVSGGMSILDAYLAGGAGVGSANRQMIMGALGLGAQVGVLLPFSRTQEAEADVLGLMYMADAGYPPEESLAVWQRMAQHGGERPPEFLSTHPAPETREEHLKEWMPRAEKRYQRNALPEDTLAPIWGDRTRAETEDGGSQLKKTGQEREGETKTVHPKP